MPKIWSERGSYYLGSKIGSQTLKVKIPRAELDTVKSYNDSDLEGYFKYRVFSDMQDRRANNDK